MDFSANVHSPLRVIRRRLGIFLLKATIIVHKQFELTIYPAFHDVIDN